MSLASHPAAPDQPQVATKCALRGYVVVVLSELRRDFASLGHLEDARPLLEELTRIARD